MKRNILNDLKRKSVVVMLVMVMSIFVGCGSGAQNNVAPMPEASSGKFNVTITDSTGETITLTKLPERIVSLAPSTTEILCQLGLEDKIVGRTDYCNYPTSIESVPSVGGTYEPNVEAIVDLSPDLVVGATHVSEEVINKLRELGITVAFLNEQENFEGTYAAINNLSILTGTEAEAEHIITEMQAKVGLVEEKVRDLNKVNRPKVYYATGYGESDYGAGGDTFIGEMITIAGGNNIAQDVQGWAISKEQIADNEPDIIIVPSGVGMVEGMKTTDFYKDLTAVKEGRVYEIDGDMISRQGPRVADALVIMTKIINPELD